jgi:exopolysaccharide production protein ExoY
MSYSFADDISVAAPPERRPGALYRRFGKRVLDLVVVVLTLPFVLPLVLGIWVIMYLGGGSGFYRQPRIGRGGRVFNCWKIRTMAPDADQVLERYLRADPSLAQEWHRHQKLKNDPRITRLGRFLRRTSLDELPQLWNVLIGDMSLIGPRPFTPDQQALYDLDAASQGYYTLRPGISGLWQVESRNAGAFTERIAYDAVYGAQLSFIGDARIAARTVMVVMQATGN